VLGSFRIVSASIRSNAGLAALGLFFILKVVAALALLKLSAATLSASGFAVFSQFLVFSALLNTVSSGGMQNGLVRQIASASDPQESRRAFLAARRIWLFIVLCGAVLALASGPLSKLLVDDFSYAWAIPFLIAAAGVNGLGQLYTAALVGENRLAANAIAQGAGLIAGTLAALPFLLSGSAALAAVVFAVGNCGTAVIARFSLRRSDIVRKQDVGNLVPMVRQLLAYSGSFVFAAAATPVVLLVVRYAYREAFGVEALNEWLVANRISDVSTQLLGLFMVQWYLPQIARTTSDQPARAITVRAFIVATMVMASFLFIFSVGSSYLIPLLLSDTFLPARDSILVYMTGDVLRVATSLALFGSLARKHLWTYMALEGGSAFLLGGLTLAMLAFSIREAPFLAYAGAYGLLAIALCLTFVLPARHGPKGGGA
jgi:O-antigen/teichoic acid export membrane protein